MDEKNSRKGSRKVRKVKEAKTEIYKTNVQSPTVSSRDKPLGETWLSWQPAETYLDIGEV